MKISLLQYQYQVCLNNYKKLKARLDKQLSQGRFLKLAKSKQTALLARLENIKKQLQRFEWNAKSTGVALVMATGIFGGQIEAQVGSEFQVNTYTTNHQYKPQTAMDSDGDFVVTWTSYDQDGDGTGVYAQRYNASGVAQGSEFRVNTTTTGNQRFPDIAITPTGSFIITWNSIQDGSGNGVYAQRFNADGTTLGTEFLVNTYTTNNQDYSSVAIDHSGNFVIAWKSDVQDGDAEGVYAQRFDNTGAKVGSEFRVNSTTSYTQSNPSVAMDSDGDFVISWNSSGQDESAYSGYYGVYAQRYNNSGVAQGSEFLVNSYISNSQWFPTVAMKSDGAFVIAWTSNNQDDGNASGVYAKMYNASGTVVVSEFLVNNHSTNAQDRTAIALDNSGNFVITWTSFGQDGNDNGIYAQRFNASGTKVGSEFKVNTTTTNEQSYSCIAMDSDGDFVIAWVDAGALDGNNQGVFAQRYANSATNLIDQNNSMGKNNLFFPNPSKGNVYFTNELSGNITVLDLSGKTIHRASIHGQSYDLSFLKSGVYLLEFEIDHQIYRSQMVME